MALQPLEVQGRVSPTKRLRAVKPMFNWHATAARCTTTGIGMEELLPPIPTD